MSTLIITSLFDIKRDTKGDGRTINDYLLWFSKTLKLNCDMVIYTEEKFKDFVTENRKNSLGKTYIKIQKLEEIPFYKNITDISNIIKSDQYIKKIKDSKRIECYLPEYNVIQYSKFGWLQNSSNEFNDYDFYFWMDAGCSRFFDNVNINLKWPNETLIPKDKLTIQCNENYFKLFERLIPNDYIWDNNSILVGTLFGGSKEIIDFFEKLINEFFTKCVSEKSMNNEQFALAILAKENPNYFNIVTPRYPGHLPLFKMLS
jgi:hypothetical protein